MNALMTLSIDIIDQLNVDEMMLLHGGSGASVAAVNNGDGVCYGGPNNGSGTCKPIEQAE